MIPSKKEQELKYILPNCMICGNRFIKYTVFIERDFNSKKIAIGNTRKNAIANALHNLKNNLNKVDLSSFEIGERVWAKRSDIKYSKYRRMYIVQFFPKEVRLREKLEGQSYFFTTTYDRIKKINTIEI